jgi:hypothetical protein
MCQAICGNLSLSDGSLLACRLRNWACARQYAAISRSVMEVCWLAAQGTGQCARQYAAISRSVMEVCWLAAQGTGRCARQCVAISCLMTKSANLPLKEPGSVPSNVRQFRI